MKYLLVLFAFLIPPFYPEGNSPLSVREQSGTGRFVCSFLESGRTQPLDFFTILPYYGNRSRDGVVTSYSVNGNTVEYTFRFPDGEKPMLLVAIPSLKDSVKGKLVFVRAGVPDGDRKYGTVCHMADSVRSYLCFDFSSSHEFCWETADEDDGSYELSFESAGKKNVVRFSVTVSDDPTETYNCNELAMSLDFSRHSAKAEIPWEQLEKFVRDNPSSVSWSHTSRCPRCGSSVVMIHYMSPEESWRNLAGREGIVSLCPDCMRQTGFHLLKMN